MSFPHVVVSCVTNCSHLLLSAICLRDDERKPACFNQVWDRSKTCGESGAEQTKKLHTKGIKKSFNRYKFLPDLRYNCDFAACKICHYLPTKQNEHQGLVWWCWGCKLTTRYIFSRKMLMTWRASFRNRQHFPEKCWSYPEWKSAFPCVWMQRVLWFWVN